MEKLTVLDDAQFTANEKLFDNQLRLLQMGLRDIGDDVHTFIVAKGITTLDDPRFSQVSIVVQDLSKNLTELQTERTSVQAMYQQTAMKLEGTVEASHEDILLVEADSIVLQQLSRLELMKTDERILREQFNEGMPQVESIELQVRSLEEQIRLKKDEVLHRNLNAQLKTLSSERERIDRVTANIEEELAAKDAFVARSCSRHVSLSGYEDQAAQLREAAR